MEKTKTINKTTEVKNILTRSNLPVSDYSANPYVGCTHACKYCYASFMKRFTNHPEEWGSFLDVKYWQAIRRPERYAGKKVFIGSVTDPYLPQERIYRRTRSLLEELRDSGAQLSIQTKSDLVLRDLDLLKTIPDVRIGFSINTLDEYFRSDMDKAVSIARRLAAMKVLHEAGIRTTCFISPIFPGLTDCVSIIERVKPQCNLIWLENLNLRGSYKKTVLQYIREVHPQLMPLYEAVYLHGSRSYWETLDEELRAYAQQAGLVYVRNDDSKRPFHAPLALVNFFYHDEIKKSASKEGGGLRCTAFIGTGGAL